MADATVPRANLVKVTFQLSDPEVGYETERVWAEPTGDGEYILCNSLFFAYGFSFQDVVTAVERNGELEVTGIARRAGHSTYRLFLSSELSEEHLEMLFSDLRTLGCTYERATSRLVAVDVPPESDIYAVYRALEQGEQQEMWTFEEAHCGHPIQ